MPASMQRRRSSSKALAELVDAAAIGEDDARRLQAIEDRHVHVHEHQIEGRPGAGQALLHGIHRLAAIAAQAHLAAGLLEHPPRQ